MFCFKHFFTDKQFLSLLKACFDFVHIISTVVNYDIIPYQNLIRSIATILSLDKEGLPVFRFECVCFVFHFHMNLLPISIKMLLLLHYT